MKRLFALIAAILVLAAGSAAFAGQAAVTVVNQSEVDLTVQLAAGPGGWMAEGLVLPADGGSATYAVDLGPGEAATALLAARGGGSWQLSLKLGAGGAASCAVTRKDAGNPGVGAPVVNLDKNKQSGLCQVIFPWPEAGRAPSFNTP